MFCLRSALASLAVVVIAAAGVIGGPVTPAVEAAGPLFVGDYSTGDFSQWPTVQNVSYLGGPGVDYVPTYSATVVDDPVKGKAARFEVRKGDTPAGQPSGERSEVGESTDTTMTPAETTRWYALSIKFDPTFPTNHTELGWGVTNQWHSNQTVVGSPTIQFGWTGPGTGTPDGYFSLFQVPQSSPGVFLGTVRLLDLPLDRGNWHDITMQVHWSPVDANGWVQVWYDGVRQTFLGTAGGGQMFTGRTMIPGDSYVHYHEGYYRENGIAPTGVIYHAGFRVAERRDQL